MRLDKVNSSILHLEGRYDPLAAYVAELLPFRDIHGYMVTLVHNEGL